MVKPGLRSRSLRRVSRRTPGSSTVVQYRKRKPSKAKCGNCGEILAGVPRERPHKMTKMAKTQKRPERPFGGVLCSSCMRRKLVLDARQ